MTTGQMETTKASDFRARGLAIPDHMSATGVHAVFPKRGRPAAAPGPVRGATPGYPQPGLADTVCVIGDAVEPALAEEEWEGVKR